MTLNYLVLSYSCRVKETLEEAVTPSTRKKTIYLFKLGEEFLNVYVTWNNL